MEAAQATLGKFLTLSKKIKKLTDELKPLRKELKTFEEDIILYMSKNNKDIIKTTDSDICLKKRVVVKFEKK